jgi:hypothetical protein
MVRLIVYLIDYRGNAFDYDGYWFALNWPDFNDSL